MWGDGDTKLFKACALPLGNSPGRKGGQKVVTKFHTQERRVEREGKVKEQVSVLSDWVEGDTALFTKIRDIGGRVNWTMLNWDIF